MKRVSLSSSHALLLTVCVCLLPLTNDAADIKVNSDPPGTTQNEVSLTLNPTLSGNILMAYNDLVASGGLGVSFSLDYGASWTDRTLGGSGIPIDPFSLGAMSFIFDPFAGADNLGNLYAGYIAETGAGAWAGTPSGIYVHQSTDAGNTWSAPLPIHNEPGGTPGMPPYRFNDKPHFTVDLWGGSPNQNALYAAWIQDDGANAPTDIRFSASSDSGTTWFGTPVTVNDTPGTDMANGPNLAIAPDGTVYIAWLDVNVLISGSKSATLKLDKSTDGGLTFGPDQTVLSIRSLPNNLKDAIGNTDARARSYPAIQVSPFSSQEIYMVYAEDPDYNPVTGLDGPDEADVYFIKSTDGGATWSTRLRLNDDSTVNDQFEPWIAVQPDGTIGVAWYDKRNFPTDNVWDVYMALSTDGGSTFGPNIRVNSVSFPTPGGGVWMGEYLGLAANSSSFFVGFTSSITDPAGDVYFSKISTYAGAMPEPSATLLLVWGAAIICAVRRRWSS